MPRTTAPSRRTAAPRVVPLFPLHAVLFPGGLLSLKVFEARYLDLITRCMREQQAFGVVTLRQGSEVHTASQPPVVFEPIGVMAEILELDATQPGILQVRCRGGERFSVIDQLAQPDGLLRCNCLMPNSIKISRMW